MKVTNTVSKAAFTVLTLLITFIPAASYADTANTQAVISGSDERRNIIGVEIANLTPEQRLVTKYEGRGVYVTAVIPTHPAAVAGMQAGDIIVKIGDWDVEDMATAIEYMNSLKAGQKAPFEVIRTVNGVLQKLVFSVLVEEVQERAIGKIS